MTQVALAAFLLFFTSSAISQESTEVTTQENQSTFKMEVQRNLVVVRVVVRDKGGNAVGNLHKEDFRLFDNGKSQAIEYFSVESSTPKASEASITKPPASAEPDDASRPAPPLRYVGLYFDDERGDFEQLARPRDAADHYLNSAVHQGDRVGIFTVSGQNLVDFTDDLEAIHKALFLLRPRPVVTREPDPCPDMSTYQAFQVVDRRDNAALEEATYNVLHCRFHDDQRFLQMAAQEAESASVRNLIKGETETEAVLRGLQQLVRRMALAPGQRNVVLISPGFFSEHEKFELGEIIDRALREKVVINVLDARGLYATMPLGDATKQAWVVANRPDLVTHKVYIELDAYRQDADALAELAYGTGGNFFENSNDFNEGFRKVGGLPEVSYVLTFSPGNLKLDGRYHTLKVTLAHTEGLTLQARRGYFAPKPAQDPAEQEKLDIREAVYSADQLSEIPVDVHTQFFKVDQQNAKLSVLTHVDLHLVRFRKGEGRNLNKLKLVTVVFDRDGKYITGTEKVIDFRLRDATLTRLSSSGISTKAVFDVAPGAYRVRQVVREAESGRMSELDRAVEIPF